MDALEDFNEFLKEDGLRDDGMVVISKRGIELWETDYLGNLDSCELVLEVEKYSEASIKILDEICKTEHKDYKGFLYTRELDNWENLGFNFKSYAGAFLKLTENILSERGEDKSFLLIETGCSPVYLGRAKVPNEVKNLSLGCTHVVDGKTYVKVSDEVDFKYYRIQVTATVKGFTRIKARNEEEALSLLASKTADPTMFAINTIRDMPITRNLEYPVEEE